jgi:histone H3
VDAGDKKNQMSTALSIKRAPFLRIVHDIFEDISKENNGVKLKIEKEALLALQEASEDYVVKLFTRATYCTIHGGRVTLLPRDFELVKKIRDDEDCIL